MDIWEEIKLYLPKYLSDSNVRNLIEDLKQFPKNIDSRIYTSLVTDESYLQGDGFPNAFIINLPQLDYKTGSAIILSNSCDIDPTNKRFHDARVLYAPIAPLSNYEQLLQSKGFKDKQIESHFKALKNQYITQMFFLPKGGKLDSDHVAFFDFVVSLPLEEFFKGKSDPKKTFSLSDYGFYLFIFKLSIHFTRIQESVIRS